MGHSEESFSMPQNKSLLKLVLAEEVKNPQREAYIKVNHGFLAHGFYFALFESWAVLS